MSEPVYISVAEAIRSPDGALLVFHRCSGEKPVAYSPMGEGFPPLDFACPVCGERPRRANPNDDLPDNFTYNFALAETCRGLPIVPREAIFPLPKPLGASTDLDAGLLHEVIAHAERSVEFRRDLYRAACELMERLPIHPNMGTLHDVAQVREWMGLLGCVTIAEAVTRDQTQTKRFVLRNGVYHVERRYLADAAEDPDAAWHTVSWWTSDATRAINSYNRLS